jgi:ubiquinone/menaquinone biosynthesis C-methylase UbiE
MQFDDQCFDAVFSYDTFEHVGRPERMLEECIRVVRKGGVIYLNFGPLYMSPLGEHAYRSITIPYCQHLFPLSVLNAYAGAHGLTLIDPTHVNQWRLQQYRALWRAHEHEVEILRYREMEELSHLDLIRRFPSCFRAKSPSLDEFIVSGVRALFRRIG